MTYEEFLDFVPAKCIYETIYDDSDGRPMLVIRLLDAYGMVNKVQRPWVGLTAEEIDYLYVEHRGDGGPTAICDQFAKAYEAELKEKNT